MAFGAEPCATQIRCVGQSSPHIKLFGPRRLAAADLCNRPMQKAYLMLNGISDGAPSVIQKRAKVVAAHLAKQTHHLRALARPRGHFVETNSFGFSQWDQ
jgi:hypothetical protein